MRPAPIIFVALLSGLVARGVGAWGQTESWYSPWLSPAELERSIEAFRFDDAGDEAVLRALYDDLRQAYDEHGTPAREMMNQGGDTRAIWWNWRARRRDMEARFETDVLSLLDTDRQRIWIRTMQRLRRSRVLGEMKSSGSARRAIPDLIAITTDLDLPDDQQDEASETLREYGDELDEVLRRWEDNVDDIWARIDAAVNRPIRPVKPGATSRPATERKREESRTKNLKEFNRLHQLLVDMADEARRITERFAATLTTQLGPEVRDRLSLGMQRVRYPNVYKRSPVDLAVESIRGVTTIDPQKRESIEAIYLEYSLKRDRTRQRILEAIRQWQRPAEAKRRQALHQQILAEGGDIDVLWDGHPVIEHLYERRALAKEACRQIRGLFGPQELETLPQAAQLLLSWKLR